MWIVAFIFVTMLGFWGITNIDYMRTDRQLDRKYLEILEKDDYPDKEGDLHEIEIQQSNNSARASNYIFYSYCAAVLLSAIILMIIH